VRRRCARASARFFYCLRSSRAVLPPPSKKRGKCLKNDASDWPVRLLFLRANGNIPGSFLPPNARFDSLSATSKKFTIYSLYTLRFISYTYRFRTNVRINAVMYLRQTILHSDLNAFYACRIRGKEIYLFCGEGK